MIMRQISVLIAFISLTLFWFACTPPPAEEEPLKTELTTQEEKLSYVIGMDVGNNLKSRQMDLDLKIVFQAIEDSFEGSQPLLTPEEATLIKQEYSKRIREERAAKMTAQGEENKREGETFLTENANKEGVVTTESGLQYMVITQGDGPKPKATEQVRVNYRGTLINGTEFDSSYKRGQPATFFLNRVVKGWTEGLQLMPMGSKYRFFISPELGYGERGAGPHIGPNATLIFEVELLEIVGSAAEETAQTESK
jgi:FKBP-type peptidyl-prolyl cis-trans isomerase FkpA